MDDLPEEIYGRLMACYQEAGRRADALAVYEHCRRVLAATLGVMPSPDIEARLRALRPDSRPVPPAGGLHV